jgi:hypothetical protein
MVQRALGGGCCFSLVPHAVTCVCACVCVGVALMCRFPLRCGGAACLLLRRLSRMPELAANGLTDGRLVCPPPLSALCFLPPGRYPAPGVGAPAVQPVPGADPDGTGGERLGPGRVSERGTLMAFRSCATRVRRVVKDVLIPCFCASCCFWQTAAEHAGRVVASEQARAANDRAAQVAKVWF